MIDRPSLDFASGDIDDLPFGLIAVDAHGEIRQYNSYESRLSRLPKERVLGRNFFRDVAPCTAVQEFHGRFERFAGEPGERTESFDFIFKFAFGLQHVHITFVKRADTDLIRILVNRYDEQ